ncbi:MAG: dephospho-CoA kinase [Gemmatimonadaceae bacterium]|nr:dephospho-CoA kinase [Gemmatimonadaceae bacterium]MCW5825932.1 dephospho-CoA kinase [Gemmatimonadaceae bacterium]
MLVLGLTGNIAAGKSVVAARLAALGAPIVDADLLAREAVEPGAPALAAIVARFGPGVLAADGRLDRAALRRIVFTDAAARDALNAIVHPEVDRLRRAALARLRASGATVVVCDIPLLFEAGLESAVDRIILVDAPAAVRKERLIRDRGLSPAEADAMIAAQMPPESKRAQAHHLLDNSGSREALDAQVDALWAELTA